MPELNQLMNALFLVALLLYLAFLSAYSRRSMFELQFGSLR
jgi:hypothetical protein